MAFPPFADMIACKKARFNVFCVSGGFADVIGKKSLPQRTGKVAKSLILTDEVKKHF